jgi:hypothetical protein
VIGTVEELRQYLHTAGGGVAADADLLDGLLAAASDRFKSLVPDRTLEPTPATDEDPPVAKSFATRGRFVRLRRADSVTVDGVTADLAAVELRGRETDGTFIQARVPLSQAPAALDVLVPVGNTWVAGALTDRRVVISGWWGPAEPWPRVVEAVLIWAARVYHERAARWSDARQDPEGGVASYFRRIPPSIEAVANGLRSPGL